MVHKCAVPFCKGNCGNGSKIGLFSFPKDETSKLKWIIAIRRKDFIPTKHSRVCERHFKKSDIETETSAYDSKTGKTITAPLGVRRLKKGTIPSLNIPEFYSEASVSSRKNPEEEQLQIEKQLDLALEQSLINTPKETSPPEDTVDPDPNLSLPASRQMEINSVENQQKMAKRKRTSEKENFNKKLNGTSDSNSVEDSADNQETTQNHDLTNSRKDISSSNLSLKKDAKVEQKKNLSNSQLSSSLSSIDARIVENGFEVQVKEEPSWEEEYGLLKHNNSDMVKIVNVESSSSNGMAQSTAQEMETKESCDTSFYKKPLEMDSRDETFGKLVACEMSDLRGNPELYLKTQQSILKLLVEAHFELMSSV